MRSKLGGVHAARYAENFLRGGDADVVDPARPEDVEAGAKAGAGKKREPGARGTAMQVEAEHGLEAAERADIRRKHLRDIGITLKHGGEAIFHDYSDGEIGPGCFQEMNGGRGKNTIAERTKPDDRHAAAGSEPRESVVPFGHEALFVDGGFVDEHDRNLIAYLVKPMAGNTT